MIIKRVRSILTLEKCYKESFRNNHPYKSPNYRSYDLAEGLVKNLIYNDNGIIVLNKPYGISFSQTSDVKGVKIDTLLPILKEKLKCSDLIPAKAPERYASGISVFCRNESVFERLKKCLRTMRALKQPAEFYECVVIGLPSRTDGKLEGGVTIKTGPGGKKGIKFVKEFSLNKMKKGEIKSVTLEHSTLSASEYASRLVISTTRPKWHSVRLYAAKELVSPILGDRIFGKFVRTVLGKPVLIDLFSPMAEQSQTLPQDLLSKLELSSRKDIEIPLHFHLCKVMLKDFLGKNKDLDLVAKPPDYFQWTCEVLDLNEVSEVAALN